MATVTATSLLLVGLLIQGCRSQRTAIIMPVAPSHVPAGPTDPPSASAVALQPPPSGANQITQGIARGSATVYRVKSGDTLTRIARTYGTTIQAIEAVNGLKSDRILVGARLKIPEA